MRAGPLAILLIGLLLPSGCIESEREASTAAARDRPPKPNLVLITIDTLRADHLGCYGYEAAKTPNIDRFAASAVRFGMATTVINSTLPSHAAILTGKYPHRLGVPRNGYKLPSGQETLSTILKRSGYQTAAFISASALSSRSGLSRGFDVYDEAFDTEEIDQIQRRAPVTTQRAVDWLEGRGEHPFFLWVHYFDPHYPYTPPPPYDTMFYPEYEGPADGSIPFIFGVAGVKGFPKLETTAEDHRKLIALYDGEISFLDAHLAPLFSILERRGHIQHTMVILVADHGESLGEHDYYFDHGRYAYQPNMHVPLMVRFPDTGPNQVGLVVDEQVETIDVFATALSGLGIRVPGDVDARDLEPLGEGAGSSHSAPSFGESSRPWSVEERTAGEWPNSEKAQFVLRFPWKLIITPYKERIELYRLDEDEGELEDLAASRPEMVESLLGDLSLWRRGGSSAVSEEDVETLRALRALGYVE